MTFSLFSLPIVARAALGTGALAAILGCTAIAEPNTPEASDTSEVPIACTLRIDATRTGLSIEGFVEAREAVSGTYQLSVSHAGGVMNQGGMVMADAGETVLLGRLQMGGRTSATEADLTITIDGETYRCPSEI